MSSFHLQIVTPDGLFFDGEALSLDVRTPNGGVTILPMQAALRVRSSVRTVATPMPSGVT